MVVAALLVGACAGESDVLQQFAIEDISVGDESLRVAMATTPEQRSQGLRHVEELDGYDGMLFVFEETRPAVFGMRDTLIPLDIWWFDGDGALIGVTNMTPCEAEPCPDYASPGPVAWALETPAGKYAFAAGSVLSTGDNP